MRSSLACCAAGLTACVGPGMLLLLVFADVLVGAGFAVCAGAAIQARITAIASMAFRVLDIPALHFRHYDARTMGKRGAAGQENCGVSSGGIVGCLTLQLRGVHVLGDL